jgi:putative membrane protein
MSTVASVLADTWSMHDQGSGWWAIMIVSMLAFWGLVAYGAVYLIRQTSNRDGNASPQPTETPREILDRRLAAGEITPNEYQQRRSLLDDRDPAASGDADHRDLTV